MNTSAISANWRIWWFVMAKLSEGVEIVELDPGLGNAAVIHAKHAKEIGRQTLTSRLVRTGPVELRSLEVESGSDQISLAEQEVDALDRVGKCSGLRLQKGQQGLPTLPSYLTGT